MTDRIKIPAEDMVEHAKRVSERAAVRRQKRETLRQIKQLEQDAKRSEREYTIYSSAAYLNADKARAALDIMKGYEDQIIELRKQL